MTQLKESKPHLRKQAKLLFWQEIISLEVIIFLFYYRLFFDVVVNRIFTPAVVNIFIINLIINLSKSNIYIRRVRLGFTTFLTFFFKLFQTRPTSFFVQVLKHVRINDWTMYVSRQIYLKITNLYAIWLADRSFFLLKPADGMDLDHHHLLRPH